MAHSMHVEGLAPAPYIHVPLCMQDAFVAQLASRARQSMQAAGRTELQYTDVRESS